MLGGPTGQEGKVQARVGLGSLSKAFGFSRR